MNAVVFIIFILVFLSIVIVLLSTLFGGKSFNNLTLLEELAEKYQARMCSVKLAQPAVELPFSLGRMFVGVWTRSMPGTTRISPRATISFESSRFQNLPEFTLHSKYSLVCGGVYGFKKIKLPDATTNRNFNKNWCIFVRSETSDRQIDTLLKQLRSLLTNLARQAQSPQWNIVNISYQGHRIEFIYSRSIYTLDSLEVLMKASTAFVETLI